MSSQRCLYISFLCGHHHIKWCNCRFLSNTLPLSLSACVWLSRLYIGWMVRFEIVTRNYGWRSRTESQCTCDTHGKNNTRRIELADSTVCIIFRSNCNTKKKKKYEWASPLLLWRTHRHYAMKLYSSMTIVKVQRENEPVKRKGNKSKH